MTSPVEQVQEQIKQMLEPKQQQMWSMSEEEKLSLATALQKYHGVFKKFWQISTIIFTRTVPTAAVVASSNSGEVTCIRINPEFWEGLNLTQRLWVIVHECSHAILDHFTRGCLLENQALANKMMDVVINHMTIEKLGFKRSEIDPYDVYCWMDKFFKPEDNIPSGQSFEYYYHEMLKRDNDDSGSGGQLVDDHTVMTDEQFKDFIGKMNSELSDQEKEFLKDWLKGQLGEGQNGDTAGHGAGGVLWTFGKIDKVKKKKKWETIIKKWIVRTVGRKEKIKDQWIFEDRRLALLPKTMSLPYAREEDDLHKKKDKIELFFFLDTSGSCIGFGERFFKAARSIPTDKFNINLFNFDTSVYEVDIEKAEVMGGGGTAFDIIERKIQAIIKDKGCAYPKAVWIITDGYGNDVKPEFPENWYWFMTEGHSTTYVDKKSYIFKLEDYE